ncbi:MAG: DEAD/DEAH box helicase [Alphaproteobacteria bacterium]|nr:DEAD/DEAH box helicase [Alphaproteobacteria bacterium]
MSDSRKISNLKSIKPVRAVLKKLFLSDDTIDEEEKQFLLTVAIVLLNQYQADTSHKTAFELAYFIVLKYSIMFQDWQPLYDFALNYGFYPISNAIINNKGMLPNITTETLTVATESQFKHNDIVETKEQNRSRRGVLATDEAYVSYVAPTSFGKSQVIIEHIRQNIASYNKFAIVVPTKSLLMQTYKNIKSGFTNVRVLIHDEMYSETDERFIAVFTQERALRLLEKHQNIHFDVLYIDEAHKLLENSDRSVLLTRLVRLAMYRNNRIKIIYLSPLIQNINNISISGQSIEPHKISINIKIPTIYEYTNSGDVLIYNRFFDEFYANAHLDVDYLRYIETKSTDKNFIYLYTPIKIERFSKRLFESITEIPVNDDVVQVIDNLNKYVHEDFYVSKYLRKGIIYIHGKIPDDIKDYLEFKFNTIKEIRYLVANNVILEGVNLPFDSLFIIDSRGLDKNSLINLIGRVNRLNMVFTRSIDTLSKLLPAIHFVENNEFCTCSMANKIKLLQTSDFVDEVENPLLDSFNLEAEKNVEKRHKCEETIRNENLVFLETASDVQVLKQNMLKLSMNVIYSITDEVCADILSRINGYKEQYGMLSDTKNVFNLLYQIFIERLEETIKDEEFKRLINNASREYYYKLIVKHRKKSLKEQISLTARYLYGLKRNSANPRLFIGSSYGECDAFGNPFTNKHFYIDVGAKNYSEIVNLSIVKIKLEEDFVSFKLNKFFQLMLDYELISRELYNDLVYGTNNPLILMLSKQGLSLNIINKLIKDEQLGNLSIDNFGNLSYNEQFAAYKETSDDFFKFELDKFLP